MTQQSIVQVLILDDRDGGAVAQTVRRVLGNQQRCAIRPFRSYTNDFNEAVASNPDVAVIDYDLGEDTVFTGTHVAPIFAPLHPKPLLVLKSHAGVAPAGRKALEQLGNAGIEILIASGTSWRPDLEAHLQRWLRRGRLRQRRLGEFSVQKLVASERLRQLELHRALELTIADAWTREYEKAPLDAQLVVARSLAEALASNVALQHDERPLYFLAPHDDAADVPWELLLLAPRLQPHAELRTPIARLTTHGASKAQPGGESAVFGSGVLYVAGAGVDGSAEAAAIGALAQRFGYECTTKSLDEFVSDDAPTQHSIIHIGMHGDGIDLGGDRLLGAIEQARPAVVVLNSCNSIDVVRTNLRRYPHPLTGFERLFKSGVQAIVAHQLPLAEESVNAWVQAFYEVLFIFHDVPLAAAEARFRVADRYRKLWELSSVVLAREGTSLIAG